jgi:hypothetical protein
MVPSPATDSRTKPSSITLALAWLAVGLPLLWGVWETIKKTFALFR